MNFYFNDFSSDLVEFQIVRNQEVIGTTKGLSNKEQGVSVWHLYPDASIQTNDILHDVKRNQSYRIDNFEFDGFAGADFYQVFFTRIN